MLWFLDVSLWLMPDPEKLLMKTLSSSVDPSSYVNRDRILVSPLHSVPISALVTLCITMTKHLIKTSHTGGKLYLSRVLREFIHSHVDLQLW